MVRKDMCKIFRNYPDALTLCEFAKMLGISEKLASKLIRNGEVEAIKVGREYRIAKVNAIRFLLGYKVREKYVLNETSSPKSWTIRNLCDIVVTDRKTIETGVS